MQLINLTPHDINMIDASGKCYLTIKPTSPPARCEEVLKIATDSYIGHKHEHGVTKVPWNKLSYNNVYDLPDTQQGVFLIVSVLVAQQFPERYDLVVPHDLVRKQGQIIGCRRLVRIV